jgi:AcrR family transcriptional regulator
MTTATSSSSPRGRRAVDGRTRLDRESIIAAGLTLAARPGTVSISVRELGAQLGADPTAIYRHFSNKQSLMRSLLDEITRMSLEQVTAEPEDWKARLTQLSIATQELFATYPAIGIEASVLTTNGPGELDVIEFILDAFSRAGLSGDELVRHYALLGAHILSSAGAIARDRSERGGDAGDPSLWFEGPLLADPARHPLIISVAPQLRALQDRELFLLGVETIIRSAERTAGTG